METKFHLLAIGQHFEWEGKNYVKTTPLIATQVPEGGQKFMPRAALVKAVVAQVAAASVTETPAQLDSAAVRNAIARYHQRCIQMITASVQPQGDVIAQLQSDLEQIYRELLVELKL